MRHLSDEDGIAMILAMIALLLMSAFGAALVLTSSSESMVAAQFRNSVEARYAADAMMARAVDEIAGLADWSGPIFGAVQSALTDGAPPGPRTLPDGSTIDLARALNMATCQDPSACSAADAAALTPDRPWGVNNPRWQPYAYGPLSAMLTAGSPVNSPCYVLLLVADDPSGTHQTSPSPGEAPGWEGIYLRAEAFGPRGAHQIIEVIAGRVTGVADDEKDYNSGSEQIPMRILSWREVR